MQPEELQKLSKKLQVDPEFAQSIASKFNPKSEQDLIKLINDIKAVQNESGVSDINSAINLYVQGQQPKKETEQKTEDPVQAQEQGLPTQEGKQMAQMGEVSPASVNFDSIYTQGYQFKPRGPNDLTGQCAWFAEKITRLADGSNWTIGNTISQKRSQLNSHKQAGNAFFKGEEQPQVGQSVVMDTGTQWGHVAVVSEVLPDGRIRLTESNWDNDQRVRNDRIIDPNDKSVVGFVKSKPTEEFKVGGSITPETAPTVQVTPQQPVPPPANRQELPEELQPVKAQDVKAKNVNYQNLVKTSGLDDKQIEEATTSGDIDQITPKPGLVEPFQEAKVEKTQPIQETPLQETMKQPKIEPRQTPQIGANQPPLVQPKPFERQPEISQGMPKETGPKPFTPPVRQQPQIRPEPKLPVSPLVQGPQIGANQPPQKSFLNDTMGKINNWFRR